VHHINKTATSQIETTLVIKAFSPVHNLYKPA